MVSALCVLMAGQPVLAGDGGEAGAEAGGPAAKGERRVLHALNRLTFGPRPGDVAAVEAMGLNNWFEMQLNPEKIDDSALEARLAQFPAMQLPQAELMARYPSQQMIRQMAQRNMGLPGDPVERAIYADNMAFYRMQQANQAAAKTAAACGCGRERMRWRGFDGGVRRGSGGGQGRRRRRSGDGGRRRLQARRAGTLRWRAVAS